MKHHVGDQVTIKPDARNPYILEFQYHAEVVRKVDMAKGSRYFVVTGNAVTNGVPTQFGPFAGDQLLPGWTDYEGRPRP